MYSVWCRKLYKLDTTNSSMYIVKQKVSGRDYFYIRKAVRQGDRVQSKLVSYGGKTRQEAERKLKVLQEEPKKEVINKLKEYDKEIKPLTKPLTIDELANFCKAKGFIFRSSDIYGGLSGFWDFGPLGIELFNNLKQEWWNFFVKKREDIVGMEGSIISHPKTWKASGHLDSFSDLIIYDKKTKKNFRVDHLIEEVLNKKVEGLKKDNILKVIKDNKDKFENAGYDLDDKVEDINLMFKTSIGALEPITAYLRGETAQGMFLDFKLIQQTSRQQLPFGIAQIGSCFRNEIAPRDFLFRSREFHIGEIEFFIHPEEKKCELLTKEHLDLKPRFLDEETQKSGKDELKEITISELLKKNKLDEWHAYWLAEQIKWLYSIGLKEIKIREHTKDELSHYSSATFDIDYEYSFGSKEIAGIANRGQYDLTQHQKESKENMEIYDEKTKSRVIPRVIEPTFGIERVFLAILTKAYNYDKERNNIVLKIPAKLAPIKAAVFPIVKSPEYEKISEDIVNELKEEFNVVYDKSGSIGRRYARNDEVGTPVAFTIDEQTLKNNTVTARDRNTTEQFRIKIKDLKEALRGVIGGDDLSKFGKRVSTRVK